MLNFILPFIRRRLPTHLHFSTTTMAATNGVHSLPKSLDRITVLEQDRQLLSLMTIIRDVNTDSRDFCSAVERVAPKLIGLGKNRPAEFFFPSPILTLAPF